MEKFEIVFYHHHGQQTQVFNVEAENQIEAVKIFCHYYPISWVEYVSEYCEPEFYNKSDTEKNESRYSNWEVCGSCNGTGKHPRSEKEYCYSCYGLGKKNKYQ